MGGTKKGGQKAASTMKQRYGANIHSAIAKRGEKGGKLSPGSFQQGDPRTKEAAAKGGKKGKRSKAKFHENLQDFPTPYEVIDL